MGGAVYRNPDGDDSVGAHHQACVNHPLLLMGGVSLARASAAAAVTA